MSRRGHVFKTFRSLRESLRTMGCYVILDGEIVNLDKNGPPQFYQTLYHRGEQVLYAFDVLWRDGEDLRSRPLMERNAVLAEVAGAHERILVAHHIEARGVDLFRLVCEQDLEGIVAKWKFGAYGERWYKIRNPHYSAYQGRHKLFQKRMAVGRNN